MKKIIYGRIIKDNNLCFKISRVNHLLWRMLLLQILQLSAFLGELACVCNFTTKTHLIPYGWLSLDPPLGALELSQAVALPLLAQMPPRVNCLLKEEQPPTASKVKEE